jgi:hypothetical protein
MAPPTIANGKVYLSSFGTQNTGTGQFCVYGLLPAPGAVALPAPTGATAAVASKVVTLTWDAVPGAKFYRVVRTNTHDPQITVTGLTTPDFSEPAPASNETFQYKIFAVNSDGASAASETVSVTGVKAPGRKMN